MWHWRAGTGIPWCSLFESAEYRARRRGHLLTTSVRRQPVGTRICGTRGSADGACDIEYFSVPSPQKNDAPQGPVGDLAAVPTGSQPAQKGGLPMTSKVTRQPKRCSTCGQGHYRRTKRAGRFEEYKGIRVELPADIALVECDACHEILMSPYDIDLLDPILEAAHRSHLQQVAARAIDILVKHAHTVAAVERRLHLSNGYLSRLRNGSVDAGYQLVALLVLLAEQPQMLERLDSLVSASPSLER